MATTYTDLTQPIADGLTFQNRINDTRRVDHPVQITDAIWTLAASYTNNDLVYAVLLPPGAIVYPERSSFYLETSPGTTLTVSVGDLVDDDRYASSSVLGGQTGRVEFTTATKNVAGVTTRLSVADATASTATTREVYVKIVSNATLTAGTKIHIQIAFKCLGG